MQRNTGEMAELDTEMMKQLDQAKLEDTLPKSMFPNSPGTKKKDVVSIGVGEIVGVKGVPCKIVHVNVGKQRFSLHPIGNLNLK